MNREVTLFLKQLRETKKFGFLFTKLYYDPKTVLGDTDNYFDFILNNDFTHFLDLSLKEEDFLSKLDMDLCKKLNTILQDSVLFQRYYADMGQWTKQKDMSITEDMSDMEVVRLVCSYQLYQKYKLLFDHNYTEKQRQVYDNQLAEKVRNQIFYQTVMLQEQVEDKCYKNIILALIEEDDYQDNPFLTDPYANSIDIDCNAVFTLTCENKFIDVVERIISKTKLTDDVIDNIIQILIFGINIKSYAIEDWSYYQKRLGKDLVKSFDIEQAKELITKLTSLKHQGKNLTLINKKL